MIVIITGHRNQNFETIIENLPQQKLNHFQYDDVMITSSLWWCEVSVHQENGHNNFPNFSEFFPYFIDESFCFCVRITLAPSGL